MTQYIIIDSEKMHWLGWLIAVIVHILLLVVGGAIMGHFIFDVGQSVPQITTGPSFNV